MTDSMAVFCPCREPGPLEPNKLPALFDRNECYFPLASLLFCLNCKSVRCPFCTDNEPVSWYCSACLMETTKQEARAASNRCMRNCLRCPRCASNALLKPVEDGSDKKLSVECANLGCGWKFAGLFSMPIKDVQPLSVAQQVRLLLEHSFREVLKNVEQQISARSGTAKAADTIYAVSPGFHAQVNAVDASLELPQLVPLRAKFAKRCRACETLLSDPVRQPSQPTFKLKSPARASLPSIEAYRIGPVVKLVLRNFGETDMDVQIASPDLGIVVLDPGVMIPSLKSDGFLAPLFLVERETIGSRQAFMASASQKQGRGWAVCEVEAPPIQEEIRLFISATLASASLTSAQGSNDSSVDLNHIGAWVKVPIVHLKAKKSASEPA